MIACTIFSTTNFPRDFTTFHQPEKWSTKSRELPNKNISQLIPPTFIQFTFGTRRWVKPTNLGPAVGWKVKQAAYSSSPRSSSMMISRFWISWHFLEKNTSCGKRWCVCCETLEVDMFNFANQNDYGMFILLHFKPAEVQGDSAINVDSCYFHRPMGFIVRKTMVENHGNRVLLRY